jgi:hypothetical protein
MKRTRSSGVGAWPQIAEICALAPWVAGRRLAGLASLSPGAAALQWQAWSMEKTLIFQRTAWAFASEAMLGRSGANSVSRVLRPSHSQVKKNARRTRRP